MKRVRNWFLSILGVAAGIAIVALVLMKLMTPAQAPAGRRDSPRPAPVGVAPVEHGPIENRRTFSGALEAVARVTIAPKVAGRIIAMPVDVADHVERGQIVARLDSDEFAQTVMQAQAELAVAEASLVEAQNAAEIAQRTFDRTQTLHSRGIASDSQLDTVRAEQLSMTAAVEVAKAQLTRAEASLQVARIREGYTTIRAEWEGGDDVRVVAQRYAEEGDTVSANTPLLSIIELDPIEAVIFATEREYGLLARGQAVRLVTDAYPGRTWEGKIERVSPVFGEGSRQARVDITIPNPENLLKPGMFVRVEAVLGRVENATIVPIEAITRRDNQDVVFIVDTAGQAVTMRPVRRGIRQGPMVQVTGDNIEGRVVVLGQQLLGPGSPITIPGSDTQSTAADTSPGEATGG